MLTTDECEKIIENCIAFDLLPSKTNRKTQSQRDKVSKFKKLLKNTSNDSIRILSSLVIKMITGQRSLSKDLQIKNEEQYRAIISDINYSDMSSEDICVDFYNQICHYKQKWKKAQEELYNQRVEYERIIELKKERINDLNNKNNHLTSLNSDLNLQNDHLRDSLLKYDSDDDECEDYRLDYDKMNISDNLQKDINTLQEQLREKEYEISILKGRLETNDIKCESEEEDQTAEEAKAFFAQLEAQNNQKRMENRKKFGIAYN